MKRILFVCSGNTCRSPLAEALGKKMLTDALDGDGVEVLSAGTATIDGHAASEHSVQVAQAHGFDISGHRSRFLNATMVRSADLIVTLGRTHRETVLAIEPEAERYTYLLSDFSNDFDGDIADPIGGGMDVYEETWNTIASCVEGLARRIGDGAGWPGK